ncbi:hypothetical protein [Sphingomonas sp. 3-13AW]|uniref:hypothetical protein n=1 Tax=Sphingomonas sp. 3-13AW TaxID=3050450 RepID=UPI003BB75F2F
MSYTRIPLAYVSYLASFSEARAGMPEDKVNIIGLAQSGDTIRQSAWSAQADNSAHWMEVETGLVKLFNDGPVDTMAVFFPAGKGVAAGYLVEGGQPTVFLHWHYADGPFSLHSLTGDGIGNLSQAAGLETLKGLVDKMVGAPKQLPGITAPFQETSIRFEGIPANGVKAANS